MLIFKDTFPNQLELTGVHARVKSPSESLEAHFEHDFCYFFGGVDGILSTT